jgi:hypothetical protein
MKKVLLLGITMFSLGLAFSQELKVEFDKKHDFTRYKTYSFGESEVITPKDQKQISDQDWHTWVMAALEEEMKEKGLTKADSVGDIVLSYVVGSLARTQVENLGPMGMAPGDQSRVWNRDYSQGSLIIDMNNRQGFKIWRVYATTNASTPDPIRMINQVVGEGFKKFSVKPKKGKK